MLGKLIKNEFVHRSKPIAATFAGMLVLSLFECIVSLFHEKELITGVYFDMLFGILTVIWVIGLIASFIGILMLSIGDYGNRFFKDQGYLTHTLPVKTSKLILARMICDVVVIIAMVIVYPLVISIAVRDFSFYSEIVDIIYELVGYRAAGIERVVVVFDLISIVAAAFLGWLFEVWHFYTAYAIGHMFNKGKRAASAICYVIIYLIIQVVGLLFIRVMENPMVNDALYNIIKSIGTGSGALLIVLLVLDIGMVIGLAIFAVITNTIFKRRLNIE